ncbi:TPA: DUF1642 domain-containing protein [Streptococcus suis]
MNKQYKVGDKVFVRGIVNSEVRNGGIHVLHDGIDAFYMLDQIHEPQKVVVPKFVAEWYERNKDDLNTAIYSTIAETYRKVNGENDDLLDTFEGWLVYEGNSILILIQMQFFGYEVEKEQLYVVDLFNGQPLVEANGILYFSSNSTAPNACVSKDKLEAAGFGWVFDCNGVKVVEVE